MVSATLWFDVSEIPEVQLEFGQQTAWTLKERLSTSGLSDIHRMRDASTTLCGQWMPAAIRHVPTTKLNRPVCERCENIYTAVTR